MSLRQRTLWAVIVTMLALLAALYLASRTILLDSFLRLERQDTERNVRRARDALLEQLAKMEGVSKDWSDWDDSCKFIEDRNQDFIDSNLTDKPFVDLHLNAIVYVHRDGRIIYQQGFDRKANEFRPVSPSLIEHLQGSSSLLAPIAQDKDVHGILNLPEGPFLFCATHIVTSRGEGPARGAVVFGQYLDEALVKQLAELTHLQLSVHRIEKGQPLGAYEQPLQALSSGKQEIFVRPIDEARVAGYALLKDAYGVPVLLLQTRLSRDIYSQGQSTIHSFLLFISLAGLVLGALAVLGLERNLLSRLLRLIGTVKTMGRTGDLTLRVAVEGNDELTVLERAINGAVQSLSQSHSLLRTTLDTSSSGILCTDLEGNILHYNRQYLVLWGLPEEYIPLGRSERLKYVVEQLHNPEGFTSQIDYWVQNPSSHTSGIFELKNGRIVEVHTTPLRENGEKGNVVGRLWDFRDITVHRQVQDVLRRQINEQQILRAIAIAGAEATGIEALIECTAKIIGQTLYPNETVRIALREAPSEPLRLYSAKGSESETLGEEEKKLWTELFEKVLAQSKAHRIDDLALHERQAPERAHSRLCVPLFLSGSPVGMISLESPRSHAFGQADEALLETLARQVATALEKVRMFAEVQRLACTDALTGLLNRRHFFSLSEKELQRAEHFAHPVSMLMVDIDHFKSVNDDFGHATGDLVLKTTAQHLRKNLRESDLIGRYGGEEFSILLPETSLAVAQAVAERMRQSLEQLRIPGPQYPLRLTVSIGVADFGSDCPTLERVLDCADKALYEAKRSGRNRTRVWIGGKAFSCTEHPPAPMPESRPPNPL